MTARVRMTPCIAPAGRSPSLAAVAWLLRRRRRSGRGRRPDRPPPGPPFPEPVIDQAVYDYAGIFSAGAIANAEATIDAIEARTGAEVVVYTQNRASTRRPTRPRQRRAR